MRRRAHLISFTNNIGHLVALRITGSTLHTKTLRKTQQSSIRPQSHGCVRAPTRTAESNFEVEAESSVSCLPGLPKSEGKSETYKYLDLPILLCTDSLSDMLAQCDGDRPWCGRCIRRDIGCEYDVEIGTSRLLSLRRQNGTLQGQIRQLRERLNRFIPAPEAEALSMSQDSRGSAGPLDSTLGYDTSHASQQNNAPAGNDTLFSSLENLDSSALSLSRFKLRAQPWTTLAGDGLVSELVSSFFACDNCFYLPFIDEECFVHDMQAGDIENADFCSPLLVNSICALRCVSFSQCTIGSSLMY